MHIYYNNNNNASKSVKQWLDINIQKLVKMHLNTRIMGHIPLIRKPFFIGRFYPCQIRQPTASRNALRVDVCLVTPFTHWSIQWFMSFQFLQTKQLETTMSFSNFEELHLFTYTQPLLLLLYT